MTITNNKTFFAPQLFIPSGVTGISFYFKAFGAVGIKPWRNALSGQIIGSCK
jgi:PhnB protein